MSKKTKGRLVGGTLVFGVVVLLAAILLADRFSAAETSAPLVREIVLDARDVAFNRDNPTLHARPGERVRLRIRNSDPGVLHSISLPGIDSTVRHVKPGEEIAFEVTMPRGGSFEYVCPQHQPKMKGRILIDG